MVRAYFASRHKKSGMVDIADKVIVVLQEDYEAVSKKLRAAETRIAQLETYVAQYHQRIQQLKEESSHGHRG